MKTNMRLLKITRLLEFLISECKLFHSIIVEEEKYFLKKIIVHIKKRILFSYLAVGINSGKYLVFYYFLL